MVTSSSSLSVSRSSSSSASERRWRLEEGGESRVGTWLRGRGLRGGRRVSAPLLAREARGGCDLEGGGRGLATRGVDKVTEYLCLLQEKVKPLHTILHL